MSAKAGGSGGAGARLWSGEPGGGPGRDPVGLAVAEPGCCPVEFAAEPGVVPNPRRSQSKTPTRAPCATRPGVMTSTLDNVKETCQARFMTEIRPLSPFNKVFIPLLAICAILGFVRGQWFWE